MEIGRKSKSLGKKGFEFKSIKSKLLVIIVAMLIIGGTALTVIASLMAMSALEESEIGTLMAVGDGNGDKIEIVNAAGQDLVSMVALQSSIAEVVVKHGAGTLTDEELLDGRAELVEIRDGTSDIFNRINVMDNNGVVVLSDIEENMGENFSNLELFKDRKTTPYTSVPFLGTDGEAYLGYGAPLYYEGELVGVVTVGVAYRAVEDSLFDKSGLGDESVIFIVSEDGTFYSGVDGDYSIFLNKKFDMSVFEGDNTVAHAPDYYGRDAILFKEPVEGTPWYIITSASVSEVNAPVANLVTMMIVSLLIVIIVGAFVALLLANSFARPIQALTSNARQLAVGDIEVDITHTGADEIGQLADSFRVMVDNTRHNAECVSKVANGDVNFKVDVASEKDLEGKALVQMRETLSSMVNSLQELAHKSAEGELSYRADASRFQGVYRELIETLNQAFDLIIDPVQETMRLSESYSNGDYSDRFDPDVTVKGDFVPFREALNRIGINTSDTLLNVRNEIQNIAAGMEEASGSVEDVASSVAMLAESSSRVSSFTERNDMGLEQALTAMNDLADTVGEVAQRTSAVSELASQASNLSYDGIQRAKQAGKGMEDITEAFTESGKLISAISSQMEEIGGIVDVISGIAEQTSLLALNAAIEAARAGDAGLGFAVVADEVKSLAQDSQTSAEHIGSIIGTLQKMTSDMTAGMEASGKVMHAGNNAVNETITIFNQMAEAIGDVNKNMSEVAAASEEQAASVQEITASMSEVRDMVRDTAREATDSAAASEEISAAIDQVSQVVNESAQGTVSIVDQVNQFKIE